jgi:hypothetical protein
MNTSHSPPKIIAPSITVVAVRLANLARMNSTIVYPLGILLRSLRANGTMATTARPFGTMNHSSPDVPQVYAWADDIITAIDHVQTAMTDPTPNPRPMRRPAITKSWVLRTIVRTRPAISNMKAPRPSMSPMPRPAGKWVGGMLILLSFLRSWPGAGRPAQDSWNREDGRPRRRIC